MSGHRDCLLHATIPVPCERLLFHVQYEETGHAIRTVHGPYAAKKRTFRVLEGIRFEMEVVPLHRVLNPIWPATMKRTAIRPKSNTLIIGGTDYFALLFTIYDGLMFDASEARNPLRRSTFYGELMVRRLLPLARHINQAYWRPLILSEFCILPHVYSALTQSSMDTRDLFEFVLTCWRDADATLLALPWKNQWLCKANTYAEYCTLRDICQRMQYKLYPEKTTPSTAATAAAETMNKRMEDAAMRFYFKHIKPMHQNSKHIYLLYERNRYPFHVEHPDYGAFADYCIHRQLLFVAPHPEDDDEEEQHPRVRVMHFADHLVMQRLARKLHVLAASVPIVKIDQTRLKHRRSFGRLDIDLSIEQRNVILSLEKTNLKIILGGPGTGKSATLTAIVQCLGEENVAVLTGWGRMAANLGSALASATTIDSANAQLTGCLSSRHTDESSGISPSNRAVVILDEVSVLSVHHLNMVLNCFPRLKTLILVGDPNQMVCIPHGEIVDGLLQAFGNDPKITSHLTATYRIKGLRGQATVLTAFERIRTGEGGNIPCWQDSTVYKGHPIWLVPHSSSSSRMSAMLQGAPPSEQNSADLLHTLKPILEQFTAHDTWQQVQFITQRHKECDRICRLLFTMNPHTRHRQLPNGGEYKPWYLFCGERVSFTQRIDLPGRSSAAYTDRCIPKGSLKVITRIYGTNEKPLQSAVDKYGRWIARAIVFDDAIRIDVNASYRYKLTRASCVTVASMQGSQAPIVVVYLSPVLSTRFDVQQLYTAISRFQRQLIIVGDRDLLDEISRTRPMKRLNPFYDSYLYSSSSSNDGNDDSGDD